MSFYILLSRSFSKILDVTGKRLIGLYEVTSVGFLPSFGIMMIFARFRETGQYSNLVIALNTYRRVCSPSGGICCSIFAVMRSEPDALSGWRRLITCLSSQSVNTCRFSECWFCDVSSLSTSGSTVLPYGVITSARWLTKSLTFSESLLAQGTGVVEFLRIGWNVVRGFFLDLSGFQMELSSRLREET